MNNFPQELLENIFQHLPQKDLLNAALVNKNFYQIIANLKLIQKIFINKAEIKNSPTRKYLKAVIKSDNPSNYQKALQATGESIKEVFFDRSTVTLSSIVRILNFLPNVKHIKFYYVNLTDDEEQVSEMVQSISGVTIDFHESNPKIFKQFLQMSIDKIDLRFYGDTPYYDFADFMPFMRNQKELKSFAMSGIYESNLMYGHIPRGEFKLKEFSIKGSDLEEWHYLESFLTDHLETLEVLTVERVSSWDCSNIIKSCRNLKKLTLSETMLDELEETLPVVTELSLQFPLQTFDKFPNVTKLHAENITAEINAQLSAAMKKITNLSLKFGTLQGIDLENVNILRLQNINDVTSEFFVRHNKIEDLVLENIFELNDDILKSIGENLGDKLKVLRIFGLNQLTDNALEIIKDHCKELKVLDMKTWSQRFKHEEWKCLHVINGLQIYTEKFDF
jgi:Leucine-rich repeat (LRR) protein